jgi:hypothetical protein
MHRSLPLQLLGDSAPAEQFARITRTIPAPRALDFAARESANAARLDERAERDALSAVARRTLGASGFGDADLGPRDTSADFDSDALHSAARRHRARRAGTLVAALLHAAAARLNDWRERYRRHVDAQGIYRELAGLDSRTLRDLGIHHRGELRFIAQRLAHGEVLHEFNGQR